MQFTGRLVALGADPQHAADWVAVRRKKGAVLTETVLGALAKACEKVDCTVAAAVQLCAEKNWQGFDPKWPEAQALGRTLILAQANVPARAASSQSYFEVEQEVKARKVRAMQAPVIELMREAAARADKLDDPRLLGDEGSV